MSSTPEAIGVFDSGVGGLSVWREIVRQLPAESILYVADRAHVPYGERNPEQILLYSHRIAEMLLEQGAKALVLACNTASAVALHPLREAFPGIPILGLEPAVKPAVALTRSGVVGVMATPATFQGRLYQATAGRHATRVQVVEQVCPGLADLVERGEWEGPEAEALLQGFLEPMLAAGADTIVLGCTHYPFVIETIRRLVGPGLAVIDPAPAVARHLAAVLERRGLLAPPEQMVHHRFFCSAQPERFARDVQRLLGQACACESLLWSGAQLELTGSGSHRQPADAF